MCNKYSYYAYKNKSFNLNFVGKKKKNAKLKRFSCKNI